MAKRFFESFEVSSYAKILLNFERSFLKKIGKTPSSRIINSLGGEYSWIALVSEPIRLLKNTQITEFVFTSIL